MNFRRTQVAGNSLLELLLKVSVVLFQYSPCRSILAKGMEIQRDLLGRKERESHS